MKKITLERMDAQEALAWEVELRPFVDLSYLFEGDNSYEEDKQTLINHLSTGWKPSEINDDMFFKSIAIHCNNNKKVMYSYAVNSEYYDKKDNDGKNKWNYDDIMVKMINRNLSENIIAINPQSEIETIIECEENKIISNETMPEDIQAIFNKVKEPKISDPILQLIIDKGDIVKTNEGKLKPANTITNCEIILQNIPEINNCIKLNLFAHRWDVVKPLPWENNNQPFTIRQWKDSDDSGLRAYISKRFKINNANSMIQDALVNTLHKNAYHPVKDYFESLKWDGSKRIDNLLENVLKVEPSVYTSEVMKLFMVAAISRIYTPGCKYDYVLILKGEQGIGKSSFFEILTPNYEWYLGDLRDTRKAGAEQIQNKLFVELSELSAMKKTDVESFKSYITIRSDNFRPAYAKHAEDFLRQCVFCGTTNEETYLRDKTGNRRFLPIESQLQSGECIDFKYLESIKEQLWAEAYEIFKQGYHLDLSNESKAIAFEKQSQVMVEDTLQGMIEHRLSPDNWGNSKLDLVCAQLLYDEVIGNNRPITDQDIKNIRNIMKNMSGWQKYSGSKNGRTPCGKYGPQICWERI